MPPCALTQSNTAFIAGAISEYPGAAGPVSGTVAPMVISDGVTPGVLCACAVAGRSVTPNTIPTELARKARAQPAHPAWRVVPIHLLGRRCIVPPFLALL